MRDGHELVCIANLRPAAAATTTAATTESPSPIVDEQVDSHMFQTIGHQLIRTLGSALRVPVFIRELPSSNGSREIGLRYDQPTEGDEVEELYRLLSEVKHHHPEIEAVCSGAILSNYQRLRIEHVCSRLGLVSLAPMWEKDQETLLKEMVSNSLHAILIKVASMGLNHTHLNKTLNEMESHLHQLGLEGMNVCGEGGEYETFTLDAPCFYSRIVLDEYECIGDLTTSIAPVSVLRIHKWHLEEKLNHAPSEACRRMKLLAKDNSGLEKIEMDEMELEGVQPTSIKGEDTSSSSSTVLFDSFPSSTPVPAYPPMNIVADHCFVSTSQQDTSIVASSSSSSSSSSDVTSRLGVILDSLNHHLINAQFDPTKEITFMEVFLQDMSDFVKANQEYKKYISQSKAPSRACVQLAQVTSDSASDQQVTRSPLCVDCLAVRTPHRDVLHVESISSWAPACIGPYSQGNKLLQTGMIFLAGQIGLHPRTMKLPIQPTTQFELAWRHVRSILHSMRSNLSHTISCLIYWSHDWCRSNVDLFQQLRKECDKIMKLESASSSSSKRGIIEPIHLTVTRLPREAVLEIQVVGQATTSATNIPITINNMTYSNTVDDAAHAIIATNVAFSSGLFASLSTTVTSRRRSMKDSNPTSSHQLVAMLRQFVTQLSDGIKQAKLRSIHRHTRTLHTQSHLYSNLITLYYCLLVCVLFILSVSLLVGVTFSSFVSTSLTSSPSVICVSHSESY